jgi:hypothetical protein
MEADHGKGQQEMSQKEDYVTITEINVNGLRDSPVQAKPGHEVTQ